MFFSAIDAIDISPLLLFQNEVYFQSTESGSSEFRNFVLGSISQSINQSKSIFQAMRNSYNIMNVTALESLERLPEKHFAH